MNIKGLNKTTVAWAFYDFANSAFATSILAVIFSVYFAQVLVPPDGLRIGVWRVPGESLWSYVIASVMLSVLILSPLLGALADRDARKRFFLALFTWVGAAFTALLFFATPARLPFTILITFVATLGFEMSLVFYNAFLKDIAEDEVSGRVSGLGFALGYLGGGLCLALNLLLIQFPHIFGLLDADKLLPVRLGVLLVSLWWFLFSLPTLVMVRDKPKIGEQSSPRVLNQLRETLRLILIQPSLRRFLLAYLVYDDGVQTVLLMASIFGAKALGMSAGDLALCYLMIQFVAFAGALLCGRLADSWGHKKVILSGLAIFTGAVLYAIQLRDPKGFWALGFVVGFVMGGVQSASRSLYALLVPPERSTEFFAFFSIVGKAGAVIGPATFGVMSQFFGLRPAVGTIIIFFVVGGLLLRPLQES